MAKTEIPLMDNKSIVLFVVGFKENFTNQENRINNITIKIKYNSLTLF